MATTAILTTIHDHDHGQGDDHDHDHEYTTAMIYGYGTASKAIISCLALLGILLFPSIKGRSYQYLIQFFIGLGVGTLAADALVHIIPEVLGLHVHTTESHDHEHEHTEEEAGDDHVIVMWKMSAVFAGIYFFFVLENGLKMWRRRRSLHSAKESEGTTLAVIYNSNNGASFVADATANVDKKEMATSKIQVDVIDDSMSDVMQDQNNKVCWKFTTVLLSVFIGDVLHNIADGLAIGISFALSATAGIGTSIAMLCHEIPHELGDFAIYLKNGASKWFAIGLNLTAACCGFAGLYIGIALSQDETLGQWLMAVIAGVFLYISLVQVMVEMSHQTTDNPVLEFALQNFGLLLGWTIMLLIGLYEGVITASIV